MHKFVCGRNTKRYGSNRVALNCQGKDIVIETNQAWEGFQRVLKTRIDQSEVA